MVEKSRRGWVKGCVFPLGGRSRRRNTTPQSQICNIFFKKYDTSLLIYTSKGQMSQFLITNKYYKLNTICIG